MKFFQNISLKAKLILLTLIPVLAFSMILVNVQIEIEKYEQFITSASARIYENYYMFENIDKKMYQSYSAKLVLESSDFSDIEFSEKKEKEILDAILEIEENIIFIKENKDQYIRDEILHMDSDTDLSFDELILSWEASLEGWKNYVTDGDIKYNSQIGDALFEDARLIPSYVNEIIDLHLDNLIEDIDDNMNFLKTNTLISCMVALFVSLCFIVLILFDINKRTKILLRRINRASQLDLRQSDWQAIGQDEIGKIDLHINETISAFQAESITRSITEQITKSGGWEYNITSDSFILSASYLQLKHRDDKNMPQTLTRDEYIEYSKKIVYGEDNSMKLSSENFDDFIKLNLIIRENNNDKIYTREYKITEEDGSIKSYNKSTFKGIFIDGELIKIIGTTRNITEDTLKNIEFENTTDLLRTIIENMPVSISVKDIADDYRILMYNKQFADDTKVGDLNLIGRNDFDIFPEKFAKKFRENDIHAAKKGYDNFYEEVETNGKIKFTNTTKFVSRQHNGTDILVGVFLDVTKEREREREVVLSNKELEKQQAEMLIVNADLKKAIEVAENAIAQQSRFVSNMSHEIRTPLNAVLGYAEIMRDQNTDKKLDHYLKSIDTAGNSLLSLVNDILDYSKVKANKFTANYTPALVGDFCEELKILFYHKINQKNIDFEIIYDTELPTFMLPISTIRQVLINLLGNASKFTHKGSIILRAEAVTNYDNTYNIDFSVADSGIGIAEDKIDIIFKEFEQADISHEKTGTGLGLALSVNFAKLVGATISVESEVGVGSKFILHMKNVKLASDEIQAMHKIESNQQFKFHKQKALILDDIADNREVLKAHCQFMNLEARTYETGGEALMRMESYKPDIILTDLRMPTMNGEEFAKNVRALDLFKEVPIICITASINPEENYHLENFSEVLNKPIGSHKLALTISKYLDFDLLNDEKIDISEFNLQRAFKRLEMDNDEIDKIKEEYYETLLSFRVVLNPKKIKTVAQVIVKLGHDTDNEILKRIGEHLQGYCESLDVSSMMETINLIIAFLEKKQNEE